MKYLKYSASEVWASGIIVVAVLLRFTLLGLGWPLLDSDEGTMGLMGMHIAYRGEHPIFFYGQGYMGAFEAYVAAVMFRLFGVSTFTLRLGLILIYIVFLLGMYLLTSLLYSKKWALIILILLALGSNPQLTRELVAVGGDPETLVCGTILVLLATWLALGAVKGPSTRNQWRRLVAYGTWGLTAGFGLWSHMLVAPFVLMGGSIILLFCWRDLFSWAPILLVVGLLIGGYPLIRYNITAPPGKDLISVLRNIHSVVGVPQPPFDVLFPRQIEGAFLITLPTATGANPLCSSTDIHIFHFTDLHAFRCNLFPATWSLGIVLLWTIAISMAVGALWRFWFRSPASSRSLEEKQNAVLHFSRLSLLMCSAITFVLYVLSPNAGLFPVATSRYLVGMLITAPALLWPLWGGVNAVKPLALKFSQVTVAVRFSKVSFFLRRAALVLVGAVFLLGTFSTFTGIPAAPPIDKRQDVFATQAIDQHLGVPATQAFNQQEAGLIRNLLRIGVTRIYSDYWTCDRIIFRTQEHILCSVVRDDGRTPFHNRYPRYAVIVAEDPYAADVLKEGSLQDISFMDYIKGRSRLYKRYTFDSYDVYQPYSKPSSL